MPTVRRLPDARALRNLREQGWTLDQIGKEFGVKRAAVWSALNRGGFVDRQPTYADVLPWKIADEHKALSIMRYFRLLAKKKAGQLLSDNDSQNLQNWLDQLEEHGVVIAYHPDAPPNAASQKGGFYYVPREPTDKGIVREP